MGRKRKSGVFADFANLFASAIQLIERGERPEEMVGELQEALCLFERGELAYTVSVSEATELEKEKKIITTVSGATLQAILSTPIKGVGFPNYVVQACVNSCIVYVGELLLVEWQRQNGRAYQSIYHWLVSQGISPELDPFEEGWIPPYANDGRVIEFWNMNLKDALLPNAPKEWWIIEPDFSGEDGQMCEYPSDLQSLAYRCHMDGEHYLGEIIPKLFERGMAWARGPILKRLRLNGGRFVCDWEPPKEIPEDWRDFLKARRDILQGVAKKKEASDIIINDLPFFHRFSSYFSPFKEKRGETTLRAMVTTPIETLESCTDEQNHLREYGLHFGMTNSEFDQFIEGFRTSPI